MSDPWIPVFLSSLKLKGKTETYLKMGFPTGTVVKNPPADPGDKGSVPGLGRSPGERNGNLLQYSCLGNTMDGQTWPATSMGLHRVRHNLVTKHQHETEESQGESDEGL